MALEIILSEPTKTDTVWEARVTGRVTGPPRRNPLPGVAVTLYVQGQRIGERISDGNGRVRWLLADLKPGRYLVEMEAGDPVNARSDETLVISEPKVTPPRVKDLRVWAIGEPGRYTLSISVVSEEGRPAKGIRLRIFGLSDDPSEKPKPEGEESDTNEYGTIYPPPTVYFDEPWREVVVDALGHEVERRLPLSGPPGFRRPPEVPEPPEDVLRQGWRATFRWAKQTADELIRREKEGSNA